MNEADKKNSKSGFDLKKDKNDYKNYEKWNEVKGADKKKTADIDPMSYTDLFEDSPM